MHIMFSLSISCVLLKNPLSPLSVPCMCMYVDSLQTWVALRSYRPQEN